MSKTKYENESKSPTNQKGEPKKLRGKAIVLEYGEEEDFVPTAVDIESTRGFARRINPLALALFEAQPWDEKHRIKAEKDNEGGRPINGG